jgi:hypothetical protein
MSDIGDEPESVSTLDSRRFKKPGRVYFNTAEGQIVNVYRDAIERISKAEPSDMQEIAASQIQLTDEADNRVGKTKQRGAVLKVRAMRGRSELNR